MAVVLRGLFVRDDAKGLVGHPRHRSKENPVSRVDRANSYAHFLITNFEWSINQQNRLMLHRVKALLLRVADDIARAKP